LSGIFLAAERLPEISLAPAPRYIGRRRGGSAVQSAFGFILGSMVWLYGFIPRLTAMRSKRFLGMRLMPVALAIATIVVGAAGLPFAAHAQFFGGFFGDRPARQGPPSHGSFFPFFSRPYSAPVSRPPVESYRAPAPRKLEKTPARTVLVIGDSMADWLGYGLEEVYADSPDLGVVRKIRLNLGLVRLNPHSDTPEWSEFVKDALAKQTPSAIVVMLGLSDRLSLRDLVPAKTDGDKQGEPAQQGKDAKPDAKPAVQQPAETNDAPRLVPGATYAFRTPQWAEVYQKRVGEMIAVLKSKGVPVLWVGLPAIRGKRSTADMSYFDGIYQAAADKAGIIYVDVWDGFVDENGRYTIMGPDFEGQTRRLRTADGVHFTKYGAVKLAHLVDQELSRILPNRGTPALPIPEAAAPAQPGAVKAAIGPVLPLTAGEAGEGEGGGGVLAGGGSAAPAAADPLAEQVLVRGDALAAPVDRADNFAWPPTGAKAGATSPAPAAVATPPVVAAKQIPAAGTNGTPKR
jgi:uncharacterized protein